jgi:hypothetical protein
MSESDPESKPFTKDEVHRICLAIDQLHEFTEGYIHTGRIDASPHTSSHLRLFMGSALATYLHGFYPKNRKSGLLPVLRLVRFNKIADAIEAALDTPVGSTALASIIANLRNKAIAHPQYRPDLMQPIADDFAQMVPNEEVVQAADERLKVLTAGLYPVFKKQYPQLVKGTMRWLRISEGGDNPPSPGS